MLFKSQNEEKLFKKWLKTSPFSQSAQRLFPDVALAGDTEEILELFREERERTKKKKFLPFDEIFKKSFLSKLPSDVEKLSKEQQEFISACKWSLIVNKIEDMNALLSHSFNLFDEGKVKESLEILREVADVGHPEACYLLAAYAVSGVRSHDIPRDPHLAYTYAKKALEFVEHARACLILAGLYYEGVAVQEDRRQAIFWVREAERTVNGDSSVYTMLAEYYQDGYIVERDVEKVAFYSQKIDNAL